MLLNVKKTKKHIAVFAIVAVLAIASIGTTVAALAAVSPNPEKPDTIVDSEPGTLFSVKPSAENKFTPEQWQEINKKIEESGEIQLEGIPSLTKIEGGGIEQEAE